MEEFYSTKQFAVYSENDEIKGAILFSKVDYKNVCWVSFIEAENKQQYKELLNYAIRRALKDKCNRIQLLIPEIAELKNFIDSSGFKSWEQDNDFLLYEMPKKLIKQITGL